MDIVKKNEHLDKRSMFFGFFISTYGDSLVMGIRRQVKETNDDSISLAKLLSEISENPELITRSDFYELYQDADPFLKALHMQKSFDEFADPNSSFINGERVRSDLRKLKEICLKAENYADKKVAHWDKTEPSLDFTLEDIFKALDYLGELIQRYSVLLFAINLDLHPHPQYPVFHIFQEPWILSSELLDDDSDSD